MEEPKICSECHADLQGGERFCPWCGHVLIGPLPPPLPVEPETPNWLVDLMIFLVAPVVCWILLQFEYAKKQLMMAVFIFPLISTFLLQWRWRHMVKKSNLVQVFKFFLIGVVVFSGIIALCFYGCEMVFGKMH